MDLVFPHFIVRHACDGRRHVIRKEDSMKGGLRFYMHEIRRRHPRSDPARKGEGAVHVKVPVELGVFNPDRDDAPELSDDHARSGGARHRRDPGPGGDFRGARRRGCGCASYRRGARPAHAPAALGSNIAHLAARSQTGPMERPASHGRGTGSTKEFWFTISPVSQFRHEEPSCHSTSAAN